MTFWIVTAVIALAVSALMARALMRPPETEIDPLDYDIGVYRDQLREVERDLARKVISADEAERARTEIKRRILEADRKRGAEGGTRARGPAVVTAALVAVATLGMAYLTYDRIGAPGYGDLPLAGRLAATEEARVNRPSQAEAEASMPALPAPDVSPDYARMVEQLREAVAGRPGDLEGQVLLARNEAIMGNYAAAAAAQAQVIALKGADAEAVDFAGLGELMVQAAGGYVSPEAEAALQRAVSLEPSHEPALYYLGLMEAQVGRPDRAFRIWHDLLEKSSDDAPWVPAIRAQIEEAAFRAGIDYTLPPAPDGATGPSDADMAAAEEMAPEDRSAMIRGMVAGLADRLATEGGPPEDWARLIGAYGVLGEADAARAIWQEARSVFAANPAAMDTLRAAAERAGVAE